MNHCLIALACATAVFAIKPLYGQSPTLPAEPQPADREALASTIHSLASILRETYVYPEVGERMAAHLLSGLESGQWEYVSSERMLAEYLTEDLRDISGDKHLRVVHSPQRPDTRSAPSGRDPDSMRRDNYAFRKVELLEGNIGYLRFDLFIDHEEAKEVAAAALMFLSRADALIIDMRHNGGGSPEMIRFITSYFFDEPTLLNTMVNRNGDVVGEFHTLESVPGEHFSADMPIFILTSSYTFSGAEEFSYNLKHRNRATIVGESTGGGAHPTRVERINDRFVVGVPYLRARNPITGTNWEGVGVRPHIEVSADSALKRALREAREATDGRLMCLVKGDWPVGASGAAAAAFFDAFGDEEAMSRFSRTFRCALARSSRPDDEYAAFWRDYADGRTATPERFIAHSPHDLSVFARLTAQTGGSAEGEWHRFRFEFEPEQPHGLRVVRITRESPATAE